MELESLKHEITEATLDPELDPDPFIELEGTLDRAYEENLLPLVISTTEPALQADGVDMPRYYLYGAAQMRLGNPDAAYKALLPLASRLEQEGRWRALALLAGRALENSPRVEAALHVAKAYESAGLEILDPAFLSKAYDHFPGECRLAYLMGEWKAAEAKAAEKAGDSETAKKRTTEAHFFWAESLDGFIAHRRNDLVDEVVLKVSESHNPDTLKSLVAALKKVSDQTQWGRFQSILEVALPSLREAGLTRNVWNLLLHILPNAPASTEVRKHLAELATEAFPEAEGIRELLNRTGVLDPDKNVETAMKDLEPLLAFAPGFHVLHSSWGVGKIRGNDGENLIIDFQDSQGHRMSINLARRALDVVPPDDLRVLALEKPDELKAMVKSDPAEVIYLGIRQVGGTAKTQDLKRVMLDGVMSSSKWTSWWKEAKARIEEDGRFDLSQAFRQVYRIKTGGAEANGEVALPIIEPRRGIRPNLNLIRRFLEQHPDQTPRAVRTYALILERWARQEKTSPEDRMAIHLQLHRWKRESSKDFHDALSDMMRSGAEASTFTALEDQRVMVKSGLDFPDLWKDTACFALSSRYPEVREMALTRMAENPEVGKSLLRELIEDPAERPLAALAAVNRSVRTDSDDPLAIDVWDGALGAATLIESTTREQVRKLALGLLAPEGVLAAKLSRVPPTEAQRERWDFLLRKWRSSERFLQPILEILRASGMEDLVTRVRDERIAKTNQILSSHDEHVDYSGTLMTRQTFERLKQEVERMNQEVRTTIAQAISRAREHGDLRENAEYTAAKQKQADYMERISSLTQRLSTVRIIEEMAPPPGVVAPGTVVEVEDLATKEHLRYWILGEGDDLLAPNVISYASPIGRDLLGKKSGERISVIRDEGVRELVVLGITPKIPDPTESPASRA
jgi:transcription elongation factor GreA